MTLSLTFTIVNNYFEHCRPDMKDERESMDCERESEFLSLSQKYISILMDERESMDCEKNNYFNGINHCC